MLKVSREDIQSKELTDFGDKAFLRFDISAYLSMLNIEAIEPQIALINAINNPKYRFITAAMSRRTGKTFISNVIAQLTLLVPNSNVLIISPKYNLSSISWDEQKKLLKHFAIETVKENAKDRVIELQNGSSLRLASVSQADSAVGRSYDLILFDECAIDSNGKNAFNVALRPTLDKPHSKAIFISTPRGKNYFYEFYQRGFDRDFPQWCSLFSTWHENPRAHVEDIEEARKSMSTAEFLQEYECNFEVLQGTIYNYSRENVIQDIPSDLSEYDIIAGIDVGYRDPTAIVIMAVHESDIIIIDEFQESLNSTAEIANKLNNLLTKHNVDFVFIDSAAAQMRHDLASMYDISTINAKKDVLPGIHYVSSKLWQLRVHAQCHLVLDMFDNYVWDTREGLTREKPKHDFYSHMADAVRYALYSYSENIADV